VKICLIGFEERARLMQKWASPGVEVQAKPRHKGPSSIESLYDEYRITPEVFELVTHAEREGFDAVIASCFADPGVDAARELVSIPVIGQGESAMLVAASLGYGFSIVTSGHAIAGPMRHQARRVGVEGKLCSVRAIGVPVKEIRLGKKETLQKVVAISRQVLADDGADTIVLGCVSLSMLAERLQSELDVPVVNCLRASLKMAELLVGCGLCHSKRAYPTPPNL
jgi:allantoin racemase